MPQEESRSLQGREDVKRKDDWIMGCDIHAYVETRPPGIRVWEYEPDVRVFHRDEFRLYRLFGWLGDVRNDSAVPPIAARRGLPDDVSDEVREERYEEWGDDAHDPSWVSVTELLAFDYNAVMEDRRVSLTGDGSNTCPVGEGRVMTYREFLGSWFFEDLARLRALEKRSDTRVVFWFDN